ncbi:MAG: ATP synthase F1 subunit epsilon, partial [Actinomycetota bacterium]|nr:ATP synthase F1 subunit epsilon [Actinomycetota bacterium]
MLHVQLVSPEQVLYEGEADMVVVRTLGGGDIAFQTDHAPFVGALATWPVRVKTGTEQEQFAVHGGFIEVSGNRVSILSDVAELPDQIDVDRAGRAKAAAEEALKENPDDADAVAALRRAEARLVVADEV